MKIEFFSLINHSPSLKFYTPTENIHLKGTLSQNFDIGPRFYFIKSRKIIMKK